MLFIKLTYQNEPGETSTMYVAINNSNNIHCNIFTAACKTNFSDTLKMQRTHQHASDNRIVKVLNIMLFRSAMGIVMGIVKVLNIMLFRSALGIVMGIVKVLNIMLFRSAMGIVLALCCHHRCEWRSYVGKALMARWGISARQFHLMCCLSSWAVCGSRPDKGTQVVKGLLHHMYLGTLVDPSDLPLWFQADVYHVHIAECMLIFSDVHI